jgi:hypothetical protein
MMSVTSLCSTASLTNLVSSALRDSGGARFDGKHPIPDNPPAKVQHTTQTMKRIKNMAVSDSLVTASLSLHNRRSNIFGGFVTLRGGGPKFGGQG